MAGDSQRLSIEQVEVRVQEAQTRRERHARISGILYPALVIIASLVLWEAVTRLATIPAYILPPPSQIATVMIEKMPLLLRHGWVSTTEILLGFLLSVVVGIPLALATFLWPAFARSVYPLLVSSQAVPKMAVAPLFIVWFGFGLMPKVFIAFLIAFFPIVINTVVGLAAIEPEKIHLARSMGLSAWATFFKIRLPNALPSIFGGLKIAITLAVVGAVVGEFVGGDAGLGFLLMSANGSMDTPLLFGGLVGLTLIGVVLFVLIEIAERFAIPWHTSTRSAGTGESL
ncbi:MAG TPA: ABC transporter permease [Opitutaceae bacterium]|nr:ABC transporter permease [Opitutaceae bacterium]